MLTREDQAPAAVPSKHFVHWWMRHSDSKQGITAIVAYRCQCYREEYAAAFSELSGLHTTKPGAGAGQKETHSRSV